jgi:hypothetical protein
MGSRDIRRSCGGRRPRGGPPPRVVHRRYRILVPLPELVIAFLYVFRDPFLVPLNEVRVHREQGEVDAHGQPLPTYRPWTRVVGTRSAGRFMSPDPTVRH